MNRSTIRNDIKIELEDFKDLARAYYFKFDWIDAWSGSLFEIPVSGGEVGELNAKIIGDTFKKLRDGDRFFYSHRPDSSNNVPGMGEKMRENIFRSVYL